MIEININEVKEMTKKDEMTPIAEAVGVEYTGNIFSFKKAIISKLEELEKEQDEEPKEVKKSEGNRIESIDVYDSPDEKKGAYIRTYSREAHGDDFMEKAKMFASKVKGRTLR